MTHSSATGVDTRDMLVIHDSIRRQFGESQREGIAGAQAAVTASVAAWRTGAGEDERKAPATALSHAPLVPRLLMPRLAQRAHARHARRPHGTTTP
jgi:hypothetical protein